MNVVRRLQRLREQEHESTVALVEALIECHRTKAHVDLGYPTVWVFLVDHLKYSEAAASRRVAAMHVASKCPRALDALRAHRVNLSTLAMIARRMDVVADPDALLARIEGKSRREVERELAWAEPRLARPKERVRRSVVKLPSAGEPESMGMTARSAAMNTKAAEARSAAVASLEFDASTSAAGSIASSTSSSTASSAAGPAACCSANSTGTSAADVATSAAAAQEIVTLQFVISAADYDAFERARALVSRKTGGRPTLEECFLEFTRFYLARKSPEARAARRHARRAKTDGRARANAEPSALPVVGANSEAQHGSHHATSAAEVPARDLARRSRHVPAAVRDEVFVRDGHRCTYVGPDGRRCPSTLDLQLDHVVPFARGGTNDAANLRVLCGAHNRRRVTREHHASTNAVGTS